MNVENTKVETVITQAEKTEFDEGNKDEVRAAMEQMKRSKGVRQMASLYRHEQCLGRLGLNNYR